MSTAWIDGKPVSIEDAVAVAADMIGGSRFPVVTGLMTDFAGIQGACELARACGAAVDHHLSAGIYPLVSTLRDAGLMLGAPTEIRRRSDRILIVGEGAFDGAPSLPDFLFSGSPDLGKATKGADRQAVWLGAPDEAPLPSSVRLTQKIACAGDDLVDTLGTIRAALAGRPFGEGTVRREAVEEIATFLGGASFGSVIFSPAEVGTLGVEMIAGLVSDVNADTRFTSLPVLAPGQAWGAAQAATWSSGFPLRTSFARGFPDHDPQLYEASRLIGSGEADLAVYVAALEGMEVSEPEWSDAVPVIALTAHSKAWIHPPRIGFRVAVPGDGAETILWDGRFGSFVPVEATQSKDDAPTTATILAMIAGRLGGGAAVGAGVAA